MMAMSDDPVLDQLRAICLALPGAVESGGVGDPTFKVRDRIFAMRHQVEGRSSLWCKAPPGLQDVLVNHDPEQFFVPPYVGQHGWVGVWLDPAADWPHIEQLIVDSYRMTASRRQIAALDGRQA
jgi:predicted DNA-binding protein (MmcQ/YjbR family)